MKTTSTICRLDFRLAVAALLTLAFFNVRAGNLLVNPSFEANSGNVVPQGWTYFLPPTTAHPKDYWIEGNVPRHSGAFYWKEWGALYLPAPTNNVAGIYQDFSCAPGSTFQADGWIYTSHSDVLGADCAVWIEVSFLDASSNALALYKSANFTAAAGADAWIDFPVTNACNLAAPVATGDPYYPTYAITGAVSQLTAPLGTKSVRYRYAYMQSGNEGGSAYFDDANLNQVSGPIAPIITNLFPVNMIFVNPADGLSFTANSPSGFTINNNAIHVVVNGVDVSGNLSFGGSASNKTVIYNGLQSNTVYTVSISITDSFNFTASASTTFQTMWIGIPPIVYLWEAEDFDFNGGSYFDNPTLCNADAGPNCYFGTVGVQGVDENSFSGSSGHEYRPDDGINIDAAGDALRKNLVVGGRVDYRIDPFITGEWVNYTRDWTNGTYWVIARVATGEGLSGSLTLSRVNSDSTVTDLGTFTVASGQGWTTFNNVFLLDTNGNLANVTLSGKETLRVTSGGNLLPNFFALVAATVDLPVLKNMYPTGTKPFEYTNALAFTANSAGATFPLSGIKVNLDGVDVSSLLTFSGASSNRTVVYPGLLPNAVHTAIISVTNSLGHGILVTNNFDTFSENNFMWDAEDFDFGGGQFLDAADWQPDAYSSYTSVDGVDFHHTPEAGEQLGYRYNGVPTEIARDYLRQVFVDYGAIDFHLAWFGIGDWADYTRVFPTGKFYVYARTAGFGPFTMDLDKVVSGAGTSNQVTSHVGRWGAVGTDNQTHFWVQLTDDALTAPVVVSLGGQSTVRLSTATGDCYPNYFMLVPATGINLSAARSGNNVAISFPSQNDVVYRVFYRTDLTSANWTLLTSVVGNGSVTTVNDVAAGSRFYKVVAP
ncbi:MAG TPA: hypothetical protein VHB20_04755 [Verrucomicrobiae bacterium]|jgi:hypothetical protein|nr:hypothetical protein [Verrucomicrobiae bacterium]